MGYCLKNKKTGEYVLARVKLTEGLKRDGTIGGRIVVENEDFGEFFIFTDFDDFWDEWEIVGFQACGT